MDLREAISSRRSIRSFSGEQVDRPTIDRILQDANRAPSAGNLQARDFIVVTSKGVKKKIAEAALNQDFIAEAPVVVVVCANKERSRAKYRRRGANLYSILDAALAAQNLMLSCTNEGLGSCYVGAFNEKNVRKILAFPNSAVPVGIIPIGHPDENPIPTDRLPIERIVHREEW